MIKSIIGTATRQFIEDGKSKFSGMDERLARKRILTLASTEDLSVFALVGSARLHGLTGDRKGYWSVTINGPWRLVFRFEDGDAYDVEIIDYH